MSRRDAFDKYPQWQQPGESVVPTAPTALDLIPMTEPKKKRGRNWEHFNRTHSYFIPRSLQQKAAEVRDAITGIASEIGMTTVDNVATVFATYALHCINQGVLSLETRYDPQRAKMTLTWEEVEDGTKQAPGGRPHHHKKQDGKEFYLGYRWLNETHQRLKQLASENRLAIGEVVVVCLQHGLGAYREGRLRLVPQPVTVRQTVNGDWA